MLMLPLFIGILQSCTPEVGSIDGTITNQNGNAVNQATIELLPIGLKTVTTNNGHFEFNDLEEGNYVAYVTKEGYIDLTSNVIVVKAGQRSNVTLQLIEETPSIKIADENGQEISTLDFGKEATKTTQSFYILNEGTKSLEWNITYSTEWINSISKSNGNLSNGKKELVEITIDRSKLSVGENTATLNVSSNAGNKSLNLLATYEKIEPTTGHIQGNIINKKTNIAIPQANIELLPNGLKTFTNNDGHFEFNDLEPGNYIINVTKDGYTSISSNNIIVTAGQTTTISLQMDELLPALKIVDDNNQEIDTLALGKEDYEIVCNFYVWNEGLGSLEWNVISSANWIKSISIESGVLAANAKQAVVVTINRELLENGENTTILYITSNGGNKSLVIKVVEENYNKLPTFVHEGVTYRVLPTLEKKYTFYSAQSACGAVTYDGYTTWIVPTIQMCETMYNSGVPGFVDGFYWSSTYAQANSTSYRFMYYYNFLYGTKYNERETNIDDVTLLVRCVRKEN